MRNDRKRERREGGGLGGGTDTERKFAAGERIKNVKRKATNSGIYLRSVAQARKGGAKEVKQERGLN